MEKTLSYVILSERIGAKEPDMEAFLRLDAPGGVRTSCVRKELEPVALTFALAQKTLLQWTVSPSAADLTSSS